LILIAVFLQAFDQVENPGKKSGNPVIEGWYTVPAFRLNWFAGTVILFPVYLLFFSQ
jgi:hypothetical protein